jgi:hypothetical protein
MSRNSNRNEEIETWVCSKKDEGLPIQYLSRNTYLVNGKKTNIHFASPRKDGTFWFGFGLDSTQLEDVDVFVFLCGKPENYYAIPRKIMEKIANWRGSTNRYNFRIDMTNHEYISKERHRIKDHYQNNSTSYSPFR